MAVLTLRKLLHVLSLGLVLSFTSSPLSSHYKTTSITSSNMLFVEAQLEQNVVLPEEGTSIQNPEPKKLTKRNKRNTKKNQNQNEVLPESVLLSQLQAARTEIVGEGGAVVIPELTDAEKLLEQQKLDAISSHRQMGVLSNIGKTVLATSSILLGISGINSYVQNRKANKDAGDNKPDSDKPQTGEKSTTPATPTTGTELGKVAEGDEDKTKTPIEPEVKKSFISSRVNQAFLVTAAAGMLTWFVTAVLRRHYNKSANDKNVKLFAARYGKRSNVV